MILTSHRLIDLSRFEIGDSTTDVAIVDPGFVVRVEVEGAASVVSAAVAAMGDDEADWAGQANSEKWLGCKERH